MPWTSKDASRKTKKAKSPKADWGNAMKNEEVLLNAVVTEYFSQFKKRWGPRLAEDTYASEDFEKELLNLVFAAYRAGWSVLEPTVSRTLEAAFSRAFPVIMPAEKK